MEDFRTFLELFNETLAAAIVVVAASMLLYNLSRNLKNRVARTSGAVLACVTITYISDVLISLGPGAGTFESLLRLQWLGVAYVPVTTFHLSDALLATTGLPSRGRRRRIIRILYAIATAFLVLATSTDAVIYATKYDGRISLQAAPLFWLYLSYFLIVNGVAFYNVLRALRRCLTPSTERRMTYLLVAMLTPSIGIFPYSALLNPGDQFSINGLLLVNLGNTIVIFMLLFLSYPLSFFGSRIPDRVVRADLMRFMLLGPGTGLVALVTIIYIGPTTELLGVPGIDFIPFAVVTAILVWQWGVDLALPWLEKWFIYRHEDDDQLAKLQDLSERLLTRSDLLQLTGANLEAACDYLRVNSAFVAALTDQRPEFVRAVGTVDFTADALQDEVDQLLSLLNGKPKLHTWENYWVFPLYSHRMNDNSGQSTLIGMFGLEGRTAQIDFSEDEWELLETFTRRASHTLDDMLLQSEVYAALEGLLPQFALNRSRAAELEYRPGRAGFVRNDIPDREEIVEQVHAALRHFWGGPGLSSSRLLELSIVQMALADNENNPVKALRQILVDAIEQQAPDGERSFKSAEWTLYNILKLRFIDKQKARETAQRLYMSEANLYRKQSVAIEAIAESLIEQERRLT